MTAHNSVKLWQNSNKKEVTFLPRSSYHFFVELLMSFLLSRRFSRKSSVYKFNSEHTRRQAEGPGVDCWEGISGAVLTVVVPVG